MDCTLLLVYLVGWFISVMVIRHRAGLGWQGNKLVGDGGLGIEWVARTAIAAMFWPITLILWIARGRPAPPVVFTRRGG
ncbi:hypothetical protein [Micromonospora sp. NBC_00617]|uniref:hypothetical protein n=1 Tax=Micromonospora sp. NBC_00617 TaxID=2903587 RepID=UPI0030DFE7ED